MPKEANRCLIVRFDERAKLSDLRALRSGAAPSLCATPCLEAPSLPVCPLLVRSHLGASLKRANKSV
jgi:hypothetical protein